MKAMKENQTNGEKYKINTATKNKPRELFIIKKPITINKANLCRNRTQLRGIGRTTINTNEQIMKSIIKQKLFNKEKNQSIISKPFQLPQT